MDEKTDFIVKKGRTLFKRKRVTRAKQFALRITLQKIKLRLLYVMGRLPEKYASSSIVEGVCSLITSSSGTTHFMITYCLPLYMHSGKR